MKALRVLLSVSLLALTICVTAFAQNELQAPSKELRSKVMKLIRNANLTDVPRHERDVTIEFIVTGDDQIVLTGVDAYNKYLKGFVEQRLNYKPVNVKGVKKMTTYTLDVQFVTKA